MFTLVCLTMLAAADPQTNPEDAKLAAYFDRYLEESFKRHPLAATQAGDHRYDDRLDDLSAKARAEDVAAVKATLEQLPKAVDYAKLSRGSQMDFEIFKQDLTRSIWLAENTKPYEEDPRVYTGYITDSIYTLFAQSTLPKDRAAASAVRRMAAIPAVIAAAKANLTRPPAQYLETAILQNRGSIGFYESGLFQLTGETPQISPLSGAARPVVAALKEYQQFLEKEMRARANGEWRIGREKFAKKLEMELDAGPGLSADEVLKLAESEAERVEREMVVVARQLWAKVMPGKPLPPDDAKGRRELVRSVLDVLANDHGTPESLVGDAKGTVDRIKKFIREKDILRLPEPDRCQVVEMPEFQRGNSVAFLNPAPPLDPDAPSIYAVSPPPTAWDARRSESYFREYNRAMLQILTIHEAYPGHYVQLEYSNRHPSKIRKILSSGTFAEGWAVYTEQMMLDQGYGDADLSLRLHQLKFYLRAVINAILDHKMHCSNMTDEQAMDLLVNRGFQAEGEAQAKVIRAKQSSCQLSTYFVGRSAFYRLRQEISREMGKDFDLGRYHEAVMDHGTLPVKYLPELVRERLKKPR
ncbi:MAG: DUF885 domain-containing protein [Gemmataceae bacterium]